MQTKPATDVSATAFFDRSADVKGVPAGPVELDLTTLRRVGGGLPRSGWGSSSDSAASTQAALPRAGW